MIKLINCSKKITSTDIKVIEDRFGFVFPNSLAKLYLKYNGGMPDKEQYYCKGISEDGEYEINSFLPILYKRNENDYLFENYYETVVLQKGLLRKSFIPFAIDSGGFPFAIDILKGEVFFNNLDMPLRKKNREVLISSSLEEFMNKLRSIDKL